MPQRIEGGFSQSREWSNSRLPTPIKQPVRSPQPPEAPLPRKAVQSARRVSLRGRGDDGEPRCTLRINSTHLPFQMQKG